MTTGLVGSEMCIRDRHIHTYTYTQIHTHTHTRKYTHTHTHTHTHTNTHTRTHTHTYTHTHTHTHARTHARTHGHAQTHVIIQFVSLVCLTSKAQCMVVTTKQLYCCPPFYLRNCKRKVNTSTSYIITDTFYLTNVRCVIPPKLQQDITVKMHLANCNRVYYHEYIVPHKCPLRHTSKAATEHPTYNASHNCNQRIPVTSCL